MTGKNSPDYDRWELVHAFVTRSYEGELTEAEIQDFEALLRDDVKVRQTYARYIEMTRLMPRLLADREEEASRQPGFGEAMSSESPRPATKGMRAWKGKSPVPGFLANVGQQGWGYVSGHPMLLCLSLLLVIGVAVAIWNTLPAPGNPAHGPQVAGQNSEVPNPTPENTRAEPGTSVAKGTDDGGHPGAPAVARLLRTYDCVWSDANSPLAAGDPLLPRQRIELRSGLVEIVFDCGARVILQGPASFLPESVRSASLSAGKVTVTAENAAAKGFAIRTPGMKTIDLGTEFGLEVSPSGIEQVHVFRGAVEVAAGSEKGPSAPPQRLAEKEGIEVNLNTKGVKLVANNGERFARSLDDAQNKRHVVAWWRFEDHSVGVLVPDTQEGKAPVRGSLDSSINGNDLYTWNKGTQPGFSSDVPAKTVTRTGEANVASLDNTKPPAGYGSRDLFTMSGWSRPSPVDLQAITPARWTIEASVKTAKLRSGEYQAFVVRDGINVCAADPKLPAFAMYINPQKQFEVRFCDVDGRDHAATCGALTVAENHWHHVAATSDGENLKLYVDSLDGKGYVLWAVTGLPKNGSTALARGVWPADAPSHAGHPYIWSVGRGYYDGFVCAWFQGWIDEVRISDVALEPEDFLFAKRPEKDKK